MSCALAIQKDLQETEAESTGFHIALNAGEPVENSNRLFGDTIQLAEHICRLTNDCQIGLTSAVKDLVSKDVLQNQKNKMFATSPQDEEQLKLLFSKLESHWQDPDFDITEFCQATAMSKSQLYRTAVDLTALSPNNLLKEFRLEKARELMKKRRYTISQITFDSGFSSPSYFTKCFKKKFGLLPMAYLDLLH